MTSAADRDLRNLTSVVRGETTRLMHLTHILRSRRDLRHGMVVERVCHVLRVFDRAVLQIAHGLMGHVA